MPLSWPGLGNPAGPDFIPGQRPAPAPAPAPDPPAPHVPVPDGPVTPPPERHPRPSGVIPALLVALLAGGAAGAGTSALVAGDESGGATIVQRGDPAAAAATSDTQAAARAILPAVVQVQAGRSTGSGFVIDGSGHVVTNAHVVSGASAVRLLLADGRRVDASVVGRDTAEDIAVLRISGDSPAAAQLGRSAALRIGQPVIAVGSPLGLTGTVTAGIVSAVDRTSRVGGASRPMVQTDASINPGNSGGPLVDLSGRVVGVNTAIATTSSRSGNIGIGFAVPIDRAVEVAQRLIADGRD
jgi:putative serine protease PepD